MKVLRNEMNKLKCMPMMHRCHHQLSIPGMLSYLFIHYSRSWHQTLFLFLFYALVSGRDEDFLCNR